ncbi:hypothetical protein CsSME_00011219 [Camellia sinensis var. sinensis]
MELQHFSHEHPLILGEVNDDGEAIVCTVCWENISGSAFSCKNCLFFLHKFCAEFPEEMNHPIHAHSLALQQSRSCTGCQHFSSKHQLMILNEDEKNDVDERLSCYVCLQQITGSAAYKCTNCSISIYFHEPCAQLPAEMEHPMHPEHPLALLPVVPNKFRCDGCDIGCDYCIHVKCSTKTKERESAIEVENIDEANLIHLPMADDSISAIDLFLKQISMGDNKRETELNHFSHHHPLILFDAQGDNNLCYENELLILNELNKDKICNACVRKISAPFYSCGLCDFFLHKWCAELPNELEHPHHPHQLILLKKPLEPRGLFYCEGCDYYCNGFAFRCIKEECMNYFNYYLNVKCAFLPKAIIHKVHEHPLFLKKDCISAGCAACPRKLWIFAFGCDICNFNLHYTCALLPDTIKHRYDEHHPFSLIYAPIQDGPDEYICEFCEDEIDPNWWFYHCIDCDQSACAKCICAERKEDHNIKWGSTYNFDSHPHCLIYVPVTDKSFNCAYCHKHINSLPFVERLIASKIGFKCEQCNIMLHPHCPHP